MVRVRMVDFLDNGGKSQEALEEVDALLADLRLLDLGPDLLNGADGKIGSLDGIQQVLPARVDGDASLGGHHVDQLARSHEGRDLVLDHGDPVAEGGHGQDGAA